MKKILIALSALVCVFSFSAAFAAEDGASLFKSQCQSCHGADGSRVPASGVAPIGGQSTADIMKMLNGYKAGTYGGQRKQTMEGVAKRLSDEQVQSVSDYVSKL